MNTLEEEKFIRAERQRKQDIYRLMLDQQVSYNNHSKYRDSTKPVRNKSFEGNYVNDEEITPHSREHQNRYFPTLADQRKSKPYEYLERRVPDLRQTSDEDRTQIYLSNCEEIIKNLRQLKVKKKQHEAQSVASVLSEPVWPQSKDNKVSAQYYPRSNYFSSQGTPYNKNLPSNSSSRYKYKDRLKTLEDSDDGSVDERNNKNSKKQFLLRKRVTGSLGNKESTLDKYTFSNKFQEKEEEKIQLPTESDTPSGLKQHFEDSSIEQEKLTKKLHRPKFLKYTRGVCRSLSL